MARFTERPSRVRRARNHIASATNRTRYDRYDRSSTPVDTATMKRTSQSAAKCQGLTSCSKGLRRGRLHRDGREDLGDDRRRREVLEPRLRLQDEAVRERWGGERL